MVTQKTRDKINKTKREQASNRTHCNSGKHLWITENIKIEKSGRRLCKLCRKEKDLINAPLYKKNKGEDFFKNISLLHKYNITLEEYNNLLHSQNYKCKICGIKAEELSKGLFVDHCHTTEKVRGLLCHNCNIALGLLKDNIETLTSAVEYIKNS